MHCDPSESVRSMQERHKGSAKYSRTHHPAYYVEKGPFAEAKIGPYELFDKSFQSLIEKKFLHVFQMK